MSKPKKPGEIRFNVTPREGGVGPLSPSTKTMPEVTRGDRPTYLRFIPFILLGFAFLIWIAVMSDRTAPTSVASPSVNNLSVPARPNYPGYSARFDVRQASPSNAAESARAEWPVRRSLTFSYERLHVIVVGDERQIPLSIRQEALTFGLGDWEPPLYAQIRQPQFTIDPRILRTNKFVASLEEAYFGATPAFTKPDKPEDLNDTFSEDVTHPFTVKPIVSTNPPGAPKDRRMRISLPPYIIHGDVKVTCGSLVDENSGYASGILENESFLTLEVGLDLHGPRGPPSTEFMISQGEGKLVRTVYVVGRLESFSGPDQFHQSYMKTRIIDLGPSKADLDKFQSKDRQWQESTAELASHYNVDVHSIRAFAGGEVNIYDGRVQRAPTAEELRQREQVQQLEMKRQEERYRIEQQERADRFEVR
jgi:hypothetical protein